MSQCQEFHKSTTSVSGWRTSRRIVIRRSKPVTIRLGGSKPSRGLMIVKVLKSMKIRWLKKQYSCMCKRLINKCCSNMVKDKMVRDKNMEFFQQRLVMDAAFSVPGIYFPVYPSGAGYFI